MWGVDGRVYKMWVNGWEVINVGVWMKGFINDLGMVYIGES